MKNTVIRFYDNDKYNFKGNISNKIECILINDKKRNTLSKTKNYNPFIYLDNYIQKYPLENEMQKIMSLDISLFFEIHPPNNGIEIKHIKDLKNWCTKNMKNQKIIFLDWDKTITVTDGKNYSFFNIMQKNQIKQYLKYILGGQERFTELQNLFHYLHENKVHLYILTNNINAENENSKKNFLKLIRLLDPKFKVKNLLYLKYTGEDTNLTLNKISYIQSFLNLV